MNSEITKDALQPQLDLVHDLTKLCLGKLEDPDRAAQFSDATIPHGCRPISRVGYTGDLVLPGSPGVYGELDFSKLEYRPKWRLVHPVYTAGFLGSFTGTMDQDLRSLFKLECGERAAGRTTDYNVTNDGIRLEIRGGKHSFLTSSVCLLSRSWTWGQNGVAPMLPAGAFVGVPSYLASEVEGLQAGGVYSVVDSFPHEETLSILAEIEDGQGSRFIVDTRLVYWYPTECSLIYWEEMFKTHPPKATTVVPIRFNGVQLELF